MQTFQQDNKTNQDSPTNNVNSDQESHLSTVSNQNSLGKPSLSPSLAKTTEGDDFVSASYCQRHNIIIACFLDSTIKFYDATTLLPSKGRETKQLDGCVTCMSYHEATDTFLIGCDSGFIYTYNAGNDELKLLRNCGEDARMRRVVFVNSRFYAFGYLRLKGLAIGSLENEDIYKVGPQNSDCSDLVSLPERGLLVSSYENGSVRAYRTNKPPNLKAICSVKAHQGGQWVPTIENINANGKEYTVTAGSDRTVKIWHLVKGKMRLLRVIQTEERVYQFVYLEKYKMIAAPRESFKEIRFWSILSGKLERTFVYSESREIWHLFLMKDRNMIGGVSGKSELEYRCDSTEFIQLHPPQGAE